MPDQPIITAKVCQRPMSEWSTRYYIQGPSGYFYSDHGGYATLEAAIADIRPGLILRIIATPSDALLRAAAERAKVRERCAAELKEMLDGEHFIPDHHIQRVEDAIKLLRGEQ